MRIGPSFFLAIALALAGCGSGKNHPSPKSHPSSRIPTSYKPPTLRTFSAARTGELITCTNGGVSAGVNVPPPGEGTGANSDGKTASVELFLKRGTDGSLVVSCKS